MKPVPARADHAAAHADRDVDDEVCQLLRALVAGQRVLAEGQRVLVGEMRELRRRVARRRPQRAVVLQAIVGSVGASVFSTRELIVHAETDLALGAALDANDLTTGRRLGRYLASVEAHPGGALLVIRCGADEDGILWRVQPA